MRKFTLLVATFILAAGPLLAQRTKVDLSKFTQTTSVSYTTEKVVLQFNKDSFLSAYNAVKNGEWASYYGNKNKVSADKAIAWLQQQSQPVQLTDKIVDMNKPEHALAWVVQKVIGAKLLVNGEAAVNRKADNQKQTAIEYQADRGGMNKAYTFFFTGQEKGFFYGEYTDGTRASLATEDAVVMEMPMNVSGEVGTMEVGTVEVVSEGVMFDEPVQEVSVEQDADRIFTVVEQPAEYPGGMEKWKEYANKNLNYPKEAQRLNVAGTVFVSFVVLTDGALADFQVVKGLCDECDKEAMRLIRDSGKWKPGKQNGRVVKTRFVMPVKFLSAEDREKEKKKDKENEKEKGAKK